MSHRILHVASSLDRYSPAADMLTTVAALAEQHANDSQQNLEHQVAVLAHRGPLADEFTTHGISPHYLHRRWTLDPTTLLRLAFLVRSIKPQVVHTWDTISRQYAELALVWAGRPPLVAQSGDIGQRSSQARWPLPKSTRQLPTRYIATTEVARQAVTQQFGQHAPCTHIPPAVASLPADSPSRDEMLRQLKLPAEAKLVAVAGPLLPRYGVKELIWAADMLRVLHPDMRLLVVGDGPERHHLEDFARTAADPANICFLGDTDRWPAIVSHLDVYWHGSQPHANSPTTMLDAMAAGVPVVASHVPQHAEWIEHEKTGYLVPIDDRAARTRLTDHLFTEIATARAIGNAARDYASKHFSLAARVKRLKSLYIELLP